MTVKVINAIDRRWNGAPPSARGFSQQVRRTIARLIIVFAFLLVFEGALRKWILPEYSDVLVFVRDPVVILIYTLSAFYIKQNQNRWLVVYLVFCVMFWLLATIQSLYLPSNMAVILVAFRYYLLFVPLAFIMRYVLTKSDSYYLARLFCYVSVPLSIIVVGQFYSPVDSFINRGVAVDDFIFQVVSGVVRPYGTFTFVSGQVYFAVLSLAMVVVCWHAPKSQRPPSLWLVAGTIGSLTMGALSGSRTYFLSAMALLLAYVAGGVFSGRIRYGFKAAAIGGVLLCCFLALFVVVFPEAFTTLAERQASAVEGEGSTGGRVVFMFSEFSEVLDKTPFFGFGVGYGTNAGTFISTGERGFNLAEYEWTRLVQELGPLFGILAICFRIAFFFYLCMVALQSSKRVGNPGPAAMLGFCGPLVLIGQITTQNTILGLTWFSVGYFLTMANWQQEGA